MKVFSKNKKRIISTLILSFIMLFAGVLTACVDKYAGMKINVSQEIVYIYLGETPNNTTTVKLTLSGGSTSGLLFSAESTKIKLGTPEKTSENTTEIAITGLAPTSTPVEVKVRIAETNKVSNSFKVKVIQPVTSLTAKTLNEKLYVLRGGEKFIDIENLINFNPVNTEQKNVSLTLIDTYRGKVSIDSKNILRVSADLEKNVTSISVLVSSTDRNISPVILTYDVLDAFDQASISLYATKIAKDLKPTEENPDAKNVVYLAHNDHEYSSEVVVISVPLPQDTTKNIIIKPYLTNPLLAKIESERYEKVDGFQKLYVTLKSGFEIGSDCYLYFTLSYEGYSYKFSTADFKTQIYSYDVIEEIYLNDFPANSVENFDLYTNYYNASGLALKFDTYPVTVADEYKGFYIVTSDYNPDNPVDNTIEIYDSKGNLLTEKNSEGYLTVKSGQTIYVRAISGKNTKTASIKVVSVFKASFYPGTVLTKETEINFAVYEGVSTLSYYGFVTGQVPTFYLSTANKQEERTQDVYVDIYPALASVKQVQISSTNPDVFIKEQKLTYSQLIENEQGEEIGRRYKFTIYTNQTLSNNTGELKVAFPNGRAIYARIDTIVPLTNNFSASIPTPAVNSSVGEYKVGVLNNELFSAAIVYGASIPLTINANSAQFTASYKFYAAPYGTELYEEIGETYIPKEGGYSESTELLDANELTLFKVLSARGLGRVWVEVTLSGKSLEAGSLYFEAKNIETEAKYFFIEIYNPILTIEPSTDVVTLYSYDSVGFYNRHLTQTQVSVIINKNRSKATYTNYTIENNLLDENVRVKYNKSESNPNIINIQSLSTKGTGELGDGPDVYSQGYLKLTFTEFNKEHIVIIRVIIIKAKMVEGITLNNVNEEKGLVLNVNKDRTFKFDVEPTNLDAFNKDFIYEFQPDANVPSGILKIDKNTGVVSLQGTTGGTGYIVISPADAYMDVDGAPTLVDKHNATKRIRVVVADGKSRITALPITKLEEIENFSLHYVLTSNVVVPTNWDNTFIFYGGLYGKGERDDFPYIITNNVKPLFNTIAESGVVEDIVVVGNLTIGGGFIANYNNGTIKNVVVETQTTYDGKYVMSSINSMLSDIGGLVGVNEITGKIINSAFYGGITGSAANNIGGIAGKNYGRISWSKVEFYLFEGNDKAMPASLQGTNSTNIGGIAGTNTENAIIEDCYVYSYHTYESIKDNGNNVGGIVGNMSTESTSVITRSFAKTNIARFAGNQVISNPSGTPSVTVNLNITNSYILVDHENGEEVDLYGFIFNANKQIFKAKSIKKETGILNYYSTYEISFVGQSIWRIDASKNEGFPYFLNNLNPQVSNLTGGLKVKQSTKVLVQESYEGNGNIVFFLTKAGVSTTEQEDAVIRSWNTIDYKTLFGVDDSSIKVSSKLTSMGQKLIQENANSITLLNVGNAELTIFSKYDYTLRKSYNFSVVYDISSFKLKFDGSELYNYTTITTKKGNAVVLETSFETEKVAVSRKLPLLQNEMTFNFTPSQYVNSSYYIHSISTTGFDYQSFTVHPVISGISQTANSLIENNFKKRFNISTFKGATSINTNISDVLYVMPDDPIVFEIEVITDYEPKLNSSDEFLKVEITDNYNSTMFNSTTSYLDMFVGGVVGSYKDGRGIAQYVRHEAYGAGTYKVIFRASIQMIRTYFGFDFNNLALNFKFISSKNSEVYSTVNVVYSSQLIDRIFFTSNKFTGNWHPEYGYDFELTPNNVVSPGESTLLTVNIFPNYANYSYLELTYSSSINSVLLIQPMRQNEFINTRYFKKTSGYVAIENGIRINKNQITEDTVGQFFFYITIPSNVTTNAIFTLYAKVYDGNGNVIKQNEFILLTRPLMAAEITIDGKQSVVMARGTTAEVKVSVQLDQVLTGISMFTQSNGNEEVDTSSIVGVEHSSFTEVINEERGVREYYFTLTVLPNAMFINTDSPSFGINAIVSRIVDGVYEEVKTFVTVTVVDFLIDDNSISLDVDNINPNVLTTYVGLKNKLNFVFDTTTWEEPSDINPELKQAVAGLRNKVKYFTEHNYYYIEDPQNSGKPYIINYHKGDTANEIYKNFLNNLYYVNSDGTSTKVLSTTGNIIYNPYISFEVAGNGLGSTTSDGVLLNVKGERTGSQSMKFVMSILLPNGQEKQLTYYFTIQVKSYQSEELPIQINTAEEFLAINDQSEPQNYILMSDIELVDYVPFSTNNILSFDGNNRIITIRSFATQENGEDKSSLSLALFTNVVSKTTLKNITVNYYHLNPITINTTVTKTINMAGLAINNSGIITNSHVLAIKVNNNYPNPTAPVGLNLIYNPDNITSTLTSNIAGFVLNNNYEGSITNSRVGGTEFEVVSGYSLASGKHKLDLFTISGQGNIAGFVYTNNGIISSSFASNIALTNNTASGISTLTAGFAGYNTNKITLSYAKGKYNPLNKNEIRTTGSGISTTSIGAGFVYDNSGEISDSYSNIMLKNTANLSGRNGAGFVYKNSGNIDRAYASSVIENSLTSQMDFNGVDDYGNVLNTGVIRNSYYYSPYDETNVSNNVQENYVPGVLKVDSLTNTDLFYGFSFATVNSIDGVWTMTSDKGPDLVSANSIAVSHRYVNTFEDGSFVLRYASGYEYGSDKNPIIIRNAKEFNDVFGLSKHSDISEYFDMETKTVFGNYRIVANIDLNDLIAEGEEEYKLISSEMTLTSTRQSVAVLDGNSFTLSNLELVSPINYQKNYYGLFASVQNGAVIMNLNIGLKGVNAQNVDNVGTVAGVVNNSRLVNISVFSSSAQSTAYVLGQNVVGGIAGLVMGDSFLVGLSTNNISVTASYFNDNLVARQDYKRTYNIDEIDSSLLSYAGGVVGIVDLYNEEFLADTQYRQERVFAPSRVSLLNVKGHTEIRGGTVGGVFGYIGVNTSVRDATFEITYINETFPQKIISYKYSAGGIVGESRGDITQSKIQHDNQTQKLIEKNLSAYYSSPANSNKGHLSLFESPLGEYSPIFVGGFAGQIVSGRISNSYARVNVINKKAAFVGGFAGAIGDFLYLSESKKAISNTTLEEVYAFGEIKASTSPLKVKISSSVMVDLPTDQSFGVAGGIAGFIQYLTENDVIIVDGNPIPIEIVFYGVNAVTFHAKEWLENELIINGESATLKYVYDFYGMTRINNKFVLADNYGQEKTKRDAFIFASDQQAGKDSVPLNYVINYFIYNSSNYQFNKYIPNRSIYKYKEQDGLATYIGIGNFIEPLNEIQDPLYSGSYMDMIFRNNNWDQEKWKRDANDLLPNILFSISDSVFYIITYKDFELMKKYPDKTFIIYGEGYNPNGTVYVDCEKLVDLDLYIDNFSGVLKGFDASSQEGYIKKETPDFGLKNLRLNRPLISSTKNGAVFSDFAIESSGGETNAILVEDASGTVFKNIYIYTSRISTDKNNAGLIAGSVYNSVFNNIKISGAGTLVAQQIVEKNLNKGDYNAGLLVGYVADGRKTTFNNITVKLSFGGSATIAVSGLGDNPTKIYDPIVSNIGLLAGKASGNIEIVFDLNETAQDREFISGFSIAFDSSIYDTGQNDLYIVRSGGFVGYVSSAVVEFDSSVKIVGSLWASGNIADASVGGLIGKASGKLSVIGDRDNSNIGLSPALIDVSINLQTTYNQTKYRLNNSVKESEVDSEISMGGIVANSTSDVTLKNVIIGTEVQNIFASNLYITPNYALISNDQHVYAGGVIGKVLGRVNLTKVTIENSNYYKIQSSKVATESNTYFGGIVAFYSDSSSVQINTENYSLITEAVFNGKVEILKRTKVSAGGIVGEVYGSSRTDVNYTTILIGVAKKDDNNFGSRFGGNILVERHAKAELYLGGVLGALSGTKKATINYSYAYGDIDIDTVNFGDVDSITAGGIVGSGSRSNSATRVSLSSNYSLTTIHNNALTNDITKYNIGGVVGDGKYNRNGENYYSSSVNLATDERYETTGEFKEDSQSINLSYSAIIDSLKYAISTYFVESHVLGSKLKPYTITSTNELSKLFGNKNIREIQGFKHQRTYVIISGKNGKFNYSGEPLALSAYGDDINYNIGIVGENAIFELSSNYGRLINSIDKKSFVSGISVIGETYYPELKQGYTYFYEENKRHNFTQTMYAPFAIVNEGVIFQCNVIGKSDIGIADPNKIAKFDTYHAIYIGNGADIVGGMVAMNIGQISDSFSSVYIVNSSSARMVEDTEIIPKTSGFVGVNFGGIKNSYSNGQISSLFGETYSFSFDERNPIFITNGFADPIVRYCYTIVQSSNALSTLNTTKEGDNPAGTIKTLHADVFGIGADQTNFYDIYATQVKDKTDRIEGKRPKEFITSQISKQFNDQIPTASSNQIYKNWGFDSSLNFGYPTFIKGIYSDTQYNYLKQSTVVKISEEEYALIPNIGKFQLISQTDKIKNFILISNMEITSDIHVVKTNENDNSVKGNWEIVDLANVKIHGNNKNISGFEIVDKYIDSDLEGEQRIAGIFGNVINTTIKNLFILNSSIKNSTEYKQDTAVGGFAAKLKNSLIEKVYLYGVSVTSTKLGYVGGFVGRMYGGTITNSVFAGTVTMHDDRGRYLSDGASGAFIGEVNNYVSGGASQTATFTYNFNYGYVSSTYETQDPAKKQNENPFFGKGNLISGNYNGNKNYGYVEKDKKLNQDSEVIHFDMAQYSDIQDKPIGDGTLQKPFIVKNSNQLNYVNNASELDKNIIIEGNINIGLIDEIAGVYWNNEKFESVLYGNRNLINYSFQRILIHEYQLGLFLDKNAGTVIGLNLFGYIPNTFDGSAILSYQNYGTIKQINTYGAITNASLIKKEKENNSHYIAGISVYNGDVDNSKAIIEQSNNYALLIGTDGRGYNVEANENIDGENGVSANYIGGIAGKTNSSILYSFNYATIIGGNGGNGQDAGKTLDTTGLHGNPGRNGGHGGDASVIGGVVAKASEFSGQTDPYIVTGGNYGKIIAGTGGNGGNGGNGGIGKSANVSFLQEILYYVVAVSSYGGLKGKLLALAANVTSSLIGNLGAQKGGNGGPGGAGGNGGNTVAANLIGVTAPLIDGYAPKDAAQPENIIKNTPGRAGKGGNGGNGGAGMYVPGDLLDILSGHYVYKNAGSSGGAGGTGFNGNSYEALLRLNDNYDILKNEITCEAQPGSSYYGGFGNPKGEDGVSGESLERQRITVYFGIDMLIDDFIGSLADKAAKGGEAGIPQESQDLTEHVIGSSVGNYRTTRIDGQKVITVKSWTELLSASLAQNDPLDPHIIILEDDITFEPRTNQKIKLKVDLDGNGKTINITNSLNLIINDTTLFEEVNPAAKIKNVTFKFDLTNFNGDYYKDDIYKLTPRTNAIRYDSQLIISNFAVGQNASTIFGQNVNFQGNISIDSYKLKYEVLHKADFNLPGVSDLKWNFIEASPFTKGDGSEGNPVEIGTLAQWNAFVELVNYGSTHYFKLISNFTLSADKLTSVVFPRFEAKLIGNSKTITLSAHTDGENEYVLESFIGINRGEIYNLTFDGYVKNAFVANTNFGIIDTVQTKEGSKVISDQSASGIVVINDVIEEDDKTYTGQIINVINNASVTAGGNSQDASGIANINRGLIKSSINKGTIKASHGKDIVVKEENGIIKVQESPTNGGHAAGIAIYNLAGGLAGHYEGSGPNRIYFRGIVECENYGQIYAGIAGKGLTLEQFTKLSPEDQSQQNLYELAVGGNAAGIIIFNYMADITFTENGETLVLFTGGNGALKHVKNRPSSKIVAGMGGKGYINGVELSGENGQIGALLIENIINGNLEIGEIFNYGASSYIQLGSFYFGYFNEQGEYAEELLDTEQEQALIYYITITGDQEE